MKVKELIEKLSQLDPELMVVVRGYEGGVAIVNLPGEATNISIVDVLLVGLGYTFKGCDKSMIPACVPALKTVVPRSCFNPITIDVDLLKTTGFPAISFTLAVLVVVGC